MVGLIVATSREEECFLSALPEYLTLALLESFLSSIALQWEALLESFSLKINGSGSVPRTALEAKNGGCLSYWCWQLCHWSRNNSQSRYTSISQSPAFLEETENKTTIKLHFLFKLPLLPQKQKRNSCGVACLAGVLASMPEKEQLWGCWAISKQSGCCIVKYKDKNGNWPWIFQFSNNNKEFCNGEVGVTQVSCSW